MPNKNCSNNCFSTINTVLKMGRIYICKNNCSSGSWPIHQAVRNHSGCWEAEMDKNLCGHILDRGMKTIEDWKVNFKSVSSRNAREVMLCYRSSMAAEIRSGQ